MKLLEFKFLTDENIQPLIVEHLRSIGYDVLDVKESGLEGEDDEAILNLAHHENRIVLTQDKDFGRLVIAQMKDFLGIVFIRPGHIESKVIIETIGHLLREDPDITPPFLITCTRKPDKLNIRIRHIK